MNGAGPVHGKEGSKGGRVSVGEGPVVWLGVCSAAIAPGTRTLCGIVNCLSTCVVASWMTAWARVWLFVSVAVVATTERTVGSEECVPAGSEGCDANGGN